MTSRNVTELERENANLRQRIAELEKRRDDDDKPQRRPPRHPLGRIYYVNTSKGI